MTTITRETLTTRIVVGEIGAGAIVDPPPAIMEIIAALIIFHRITDRGWRVPGR
jgi:hypothetical protein